MFGLHGPDKHCKAPERGNSFASGATSSLGVFKAKASTRLHVLLNEFYKTRDSNYDCMLILKSSFSPNECLLHSVGGDLQLIRSKEERVIQLDAYQNAMNKFTEFLKKHYFQSDL